MPNVFDLTTVNLSSGKEITEILAQGKEIRMERIVSSGQTSLKGFWYDQDENEFVMVLQGEARIQFEDNTEQHFQTGDYIIIPAHLKHRVTYTSSEPECIWFAIFYR